jgi:membrane protein YdbS with pleckstrin-like domain
MLGDVTRRPRTGQPPGAQSDGSVRSRQIPADSSPVATTVTPTAPSAWSAGPLAGDVPTERRRLPARVTRYWRWRAFYSSLPLLVLLVSGAIVLPWGPWWIRWGVVAVFTAVIAACMIILPPIRYRVFWYAISTTEIDIQSGIIFTTRSLVPMHRVQTLQSERGPIADHYQMTTLKIRTAAGSVSLSGMDRAEADELCERISRMTSFADDV